MHVGRHVFVGQVTVKKSALPLEYKYMIADDAGTVVCTEREKHKTSDRQVVLVHAHMNVCVCVRVCVCVCACVRAFVCVRVCIHISIYLSIYLSNIYI